jgi:hypothetical protein
MSFRNIAINKLPGAAQLYSRILRHAAGTRRGGKEIPVALPKLDLLCTDIDIDRVHVQTYSDVCGFESSNSTVRGAINAPVTYPFALTFPLQMMLMSDDLFPHSLLGTVHLTNSIQQYSSLPAGGKVDAKISFSDAYTYHEKGLCFTVTSELLDPASKKVLWRNESLMMQRRPNLCIPDGAIVYESRIKEDSVVALTESEKFKLPGSLGRRYALASGDYNPIHLSGPSAALFGFRQGPIMHGMWTKARALAAVMKDRPAEEASQASQVDRDSDVPMCEAYVEFKTPLFLPGEVCLTTGPLPLPLGAALTAHSKHNSDNSSGVIFQVRNVAGDQLPHLRGVCSWQTK